MLGSLLPIAGSLISGFFSGSAAKSQAKAAAEAQAQANRTNVALQQQANELAMRDKEIDRELQEKFARTGVRWRTEDALAAGIHPLYALGANTASYAPSSVSFGAGRVEPVSTGGSGHMASAMGQNLGRAIAATRTESERDRAYTQTAQTLSLEKAGLENELLKSQIAQLRGQIGPPMPGGGSATAALTKWPAGLEMPENWRLPQEKGPDPQPRIFLGKNNEIILDPNVTNADTTNKVFGDEGPIPVGLNTIKGMRHILHHLGQVTNIKYAPPKSWWDYLPSIKYRP